VYALHPKPEHVVGNVSDRLIRTQIVKHVGVRVVELFQRARGPIVHTFLKSFACHGNCILLLALNRYHSSIERSLYLRTLCLILLCIANMVLVTPASVIAVGVVLPLLAAISVGLRFVVRRSRTAYVGVDDWLILFALVSRDWFL